MKLNLKKPIVFFDLETTGIDVVNDRIVEICLLKVHPDGHDETHTFRINPTVPIPPETTAIHGISNEDIKDCPTFSDLAKTITQMLTGCYIAGYNSNKFDLPLLAEEILRANIDFDLKRLQPIDVQVIFHKMEKRTLEAAYRFYCKKTLENAHSAEADTRATYEVLKAQLDHYDELQNDMAFLSEFSAHKRNVDFAGRIVYDDKDVEVFNFGKFKGQAVTEVLNKNPGYYAWMMDSDFPLYTKRVLTAIKLRDFNKK